MTDNQKWFVLIVVALVIAGVFMGHASYAVQEQKHQQNIECIKNGGTYKAPGIDQGQLICQK